MICGIVPIMYGIYKDITSASMTITSRPMTIASRPVTITGTPMTTRNDSISA